MKFLHLADLHIGKNVNEFSMIDDQRYILEQIIRVAEDHKVDGILIAGDVYDKSIPSEEAVRTMDNFLNSLSERNIPVFMISGNHDSDERLNYGSRLFEKNHIYIVGKYEGKTRYTEMEDEFGRIRIWLFPFVKISTVRHYDDSLELSSYHDAFQYLVSQCPVDPADRNIAVAHQFVTGRNSEVVYAGSENGAINVGTVDNIYADCFDSFDYTALGHIHRAQSVGRETIRYSGTPLKYSLSEINDEKTIPLVHMKEKGNVTIEYIPLHPKKDMRKIKGELKKLLEKAEVSEDYIYAVLTDEEIQFDAMERLRNYYPNIMRLEYENDRKRPDSFLNVQTREKTFEELIESFFEAITGGKMSEEEREILYQTAREAGVIE